MASKYLELDIQMIIHVHKNLAKHSYQEQYDLNKNNYF